MNDLADLAAPIQTGIHRLLLTGAAGALGQVLRPRLKKHCAILRVSDIAALGTAGPGEELQTVPLEDKAAVQALLEGVDAVVHLGGVSTEKAFETVLPANIVGAYNVYEAARIHGVKRIVFASSNHVTGFRKQSEYVEPSMPPRPDGYYGISKAFGENLGQFYFDRYGIETVSLRIGSCVPVPRDRRMLATWLSYDDLERLVVASLTAPNVGHTVIYGMSNNKNAWWDNSSAQHIGYVPRDSAESFRAAIEASAIASDTASATEIYQGGAFVTRGPF